MCQDCRDKSLERSEKAHRAQRQNPLDARVGRVHRDAAIAHLNLAYEREYITEAEREGRVDKAARAVIQRELIALVADIRSMNELEAELKPVKPEKEPEPVRPRKSKLYTAAIIIDTVILVLLIINSVFTFVH